MKHLLLFFTAMITLVGCLNPASNQPETWRFAIEESEGSVQHAYALNFKELLESRTAGQVEVLIYPYGTLGTSTHVTEQLNMGIVELAMASPGSLGKFIPEMQVLLLHFLLPEDPLQVRELLTDADLLELFDSLYSPKGLKLLSIYSEGQMVWTMKEQVRRPADFSGMKMRVMTSPLLLAAYDAYGASPTPMPYSEVYSGLQLNMIDGQVNPVFAIERQKFHEVTSWMIFPRHASFITTCAANRNFYAGLSDARRKLVDAAIVELDQHIHDTQVASQVTRLQEIITDKRRQRSKLHVIGKLDWFLAALDEKERRELVEENEFFELHPELSHAERDQFVAASQQVRDIYLRIGGEKAGQLLAAIEAVEKE